MKGAVRRISECEVFAKIFMTSEDDRVDVLSFINKWAIF